MDAPRASEGGAARVLEQCLSGEVPQANALPQLLFFYGESPESVIEALNEKALLVINNADAGAAAFKAGAALVELATQIDVRQAAAASSSRAPPQRNVTKALLESVLAVVGGPKRAARDKAPRAVGCALLAALAPSVGSNRALEEKLVAYSSDKVPSIRERAVRALAALAGESPCVARALAARTVDPCAPIRTAAVKALLACGSVSAAVVERIDDVEVSVRAQLFQSLAEQPAAVDNLGPAAMIRLVVGLTDRASAVRAAAAAAVDVWVQRFQGPLMLLSRCDVMGDEILGETAARALAGRYTEESSKVAHRWMDASGAQATGAKGAYATVAAALLARAALMTMHEDARDSALDVPAVVSHATQSLDLATRSGDTGKRHCFILRQALQILLAADTCDEVSRRSVEDLAESVLLRAPPQSEVSTVNIRFALSAIDLGMLLLRKCCGVSSCQARPKRRQALETSLSRRVVLLVSDLCEPLCGDAGDALQQAANGEGGEHNGFTGRLSSRLQELEVAIDKMAQQMAELIKEKKQASIDEDFMKAHKLKIEARRVEVELAALRAERDGLTTSRDDVCLREIAIVSALLRWSTSDVRRDPALFGTLEGILRPMVSLPALTEEVDVAAVTGICLFCLRDGPTARSHWNLLLTLVRALREETSSSTQTQLVRSRAAVAARALCDCARMYGPLHDGNYLDREEVMAAAALLSSVPFPARHIMVEPMCSWLLSFGHIFFEEHLREPVLEVQWALGWLLVEAFRQSVVSVEGGDPCAQKDGGEGSAVRCDSRTASSIEEGMSGQCPESSAIASRLAQFFTLLPKLPGKHGAPMLLLAVESIAETGLWRHSVLMPQKSGEHTRWLRGFSWPQLFAFASERLPAELLFRLWRCSLQLCVTGPELAPLAEVPLALAAAASMGTPPQGAADLLREALDLGADADALSPLIARLPPAPGREVKKGKRPAPPTWLQPRVDAEAAEAARRTELAELGICDLQRWIPAEVEVPEEVPVHHRMRAGQRRNKAAKGAASNSTKPAPAPAATNASAAPAAMPTDAALAGRGASSDAAASSGPVLPVHLGPDAKRKRCRSKTEGPNPSHRQG